MEKRKVVRKSQSQKENLHPVAVSPTGHGEAVSLVDLPVVLAQCNDLLALQERLILTSVERQRELEERGEACRVECEEVYAQLDKEKLKHAETMTALEAEREKVQMAHTEISVLRKQLEREKATFEKAFGLAKSQALSDSSKAEQILIKCTALETLCAKKDEELAGKNKQLEVLRRKMRSMKETHKQEMESLHLKVQQEMYIAQTLNHNRLPVVTWNKSTKRKQ